MFLGIRQRFVARDRGKAQGCDPMGVVEGSCGFPCSAGGYPGKLVFLGRLWVQESGDVLTMDEQGYDTSVA